ncbi:MAG TPA: IS1182 family transposase [Lacipirellulaceae bacterium]
MLQLEQYTPLTDFERQLFLRLVPEDHFLRRLPGVIDFERFRPLLASHYAPGAGRPALDPVLMLKLELLSIHYRWSDRELMRQVQVNMAHRLFLNLGSDSVLPHPTSMTYFRDRVGAETLQEIFHGVLGQARERGLVKDRLRLKDATHLIANLALPTTIALVAQMRDRLLETAEPFAAEQVAAEWQQVDVWCARSEDLPDVERLALRVQHLREVLAWADELPASAAFRDGAAKAQDKLRAALALAHKVLADRDDPQASDKLLSVYDPDARCGKHGDFFAGYLADVTMDADSELITGINVLPANGDEGSDAAYLIAQEEAAQGNDVEAISIDGAGYRGAVLRELTDPEGLKLEVFTPPTARVALTVFSPADFTLSEDRKTLTCPAGQTTTQHERNTNDTGVKFRFAKKQCGGCALRDKCLADPQTKSRTVVKNDYEAEYQAAQAKAQTPAYAQVRKEHPAIERKLAELVNRHDLRQARYRGLSKVLRQALLTGIAVNLKRLVKLQTPPERPATGKVRAASLPSA